MNYGSDPFQKPKSEIKTITSYHSVLILFAARNKKQSQHKIRFENAWVKEVGCKEEVQRC